MGLVNVIIMVTTVQLCFADYKVLFAFIQLRISGMKLTSEVVESRLKPRSGDCSSFAPGADCGEGPALCQAPVQPDTPVPPRPTPLC